MYLNDRKTILYIVKGLKGVKMAKKKITMKPSDVIRLTARYSGYTQEVAKDIIDAYGHIIYKLLLEGYQIRMPEVGRFYLKTNDPRPERPFVMPQTGEHVVLPATPEHQVPKFKFTPTLTKEIKEKSWGNLL